MPFDLRSIFATLTARRDLTREQSRALFDRIMSGALSELELAGVAAAIAVKVEAVDEVVGAAEAMRSKYIPIRCSEECIDTCGTGGDGVSTFNVSTTAAIVAAAAGATVAKHGNRSTTRVSGSTEVLSLLGIDVDAPVETVEQSLAEARIGYLNAQQLHPAMKFAAPVRRALPIKTIFNLLGPLTNPAGAKRQLLGVPRIDLTEFMARALLDLGATRAWVVHGDGLCDVTITGDTHVVELCNGSIRCFVVSPESVGLRRALLDELRVSSPEQSAARVMDVLGGSPGAARDHTLMNAGAALVVAGKTNDLKDGVIRAADAIDSGSAMRTLDQWRSIAGTSGRSAMTKGTRS